MTTDYLLSPNIRAALIAARDQGNAWRAPGFVHTTTFARLIGRLLVDGLLRSDGTLTEHGRAIIGDAQEAA